MRYVIAMIVVLIGVPSVMLGVNFSQVSSVGSPLQQKLMSIIGAGAAQSSSGSVQNQEGSVGEQCAICHENFKTEISLPCNPNHKFCKECILTWLAREPTCPMCRATVLESPDFDASWKSEIEAKRGNRMQHIAQHLGYMTPLPFLTGVALTAASGIRSAGAFIGFLLAHPEATIISTGINICVGPTWYATFIVSYMLEGTQGLYDNIKNLLTVVGYATGAGIAFGAGAIALDAMSKRSYRSEEGDIQYSASEIKKCLEGRIAQAIWIGFVLGLYGDLLYNRLVTAPKDAEVSLTIEEKDSQHEKASPENVTITQNEDWQAALVQ